MTTTTATTSATMAAAGHDARQRGAAKDAKDPSSSSSRSTSSLLSPLSASFPSEILPPNPPSPCVCKNNDALKTPITPPSAYLDFLKNFSPAVQSPVSTTSARFSFSDKTLLDRSVDTSGRKAVSPPTSQPPTSLSRNSSSASTTTEQSVSSNSSSRAVTEEIPTSDSPRLVIPPSPVGRPAPRSARAPRRLHIPQSPFSPSIASAQSLPSPYVSTPLSGMPWSASYLPCDGKPDVNGQPGKVHIRQVVTRTVTYCRTPLDPAPRGKRRKIAFGDHVHDEGTGRLSRITDCKEPISAKCERFEKVAKVEEY